MCHSQPDQSHLYQPLPTWGGKGPLSKRKRRAESPQKSVSLKEWAEQQDAKELRAIRGKAPMEELPEVAMISTVSSKSSEKAEQRRAEVPATKRIAEDPDKLTGKVKLMTRILASLIVPKVRMDMATHLNSIPETDQGNHSQTKVDGRKLDPLPVPPSQLLPGLVATGLVTPVPLDVHHSPHLDKPRISLEQLT